MIFGKVLKRNTIGNIYSCQTYIKSHNEIYVDNKYIISKTSFVVQQSPCSQSREVDLENEDPEMEGEKQANKNENHATENLSIPFGRNSRGLAQIIPSHLCHYILEPWKKRQTKCQTSRKSTTCFGRSWIPLTNWCCPPSWSPLYLNPFQIYVRSRGQCPINNLIHTQNIN